MKAIIPVALLGFGNVGRALARLLLLKKAEIKQNHGVSFEVVGIATQRHGSAIDQDGLDLQGALKLINDEGNLADLSSPSPQMEALEFIEKCDAQVLFETTPVNYKTGQPAVDYLRRALELDMHVITANKGPVVHAFRELSAMAEARNRRFYFESAVMDGAPIFSLWRYSLPGANLTSFRGVLNSTTNFILSLMEGGNSFESALGQAQSIGIAETDPSGDIDGWDAAVKVAALVTVLMDMPITPEEVDRKGIREISEEMIQKSLSAGKRWKLICHAQVVPGGVKSEVYPREIDHTDPLFNVMGTSSSITFESDVLGALTIIENDPGPETTAYGLMADFINAVRGEPGTFST